MNAFQRLRRERIAMSTRPFQARGGSIVRCEGCGLPEVYCACELMPHGLPASDLLADVWHWTYETVKYRPVDCRRFRNIHMRFCGREQTWWNIAEATEWSCLFSGHCFPSYVRDEDVRTVLSSTSSLAKRPLYVLLDGTWTEARKMFRKSPYLDKFPVISVQPETLSAYRLRGCGTR